MMEKSKSEKPANKDIEPSEVAAVVGLLVVLITIGVSWIIHSCDQSIKNYQTSRASTTAKATQVISASK